MTAPPGATLPCGVIDDAFRGHVRDWLETYAAGTMARGLSLTLPLWAGMIRECGLRARLEDSPPSARCSLYEAIEPAEFVAYAVLADGSEVTIPAPPIEMRG